MGIKKLTSKEEFFVAEYLKDFNGARAVKAAGFTTRNAREYAFRLRTKGHIASAIDAGKRAKMKKIDVSVERILEELNYVAFSRMGKFAKVDESGEMSFTATEDLSESGDDAAIQGYSQTKSKDGGSTGIKLHDKMKALELLGKYNGIWDKNANDNPDDANKRIERDRLLESLRKPK